MTEDPSEIAKRHATKEPKAIGEDYAVRMPRPIGGEPESEIRDLVTPAEPDYTREDVQAWARKVARRKND